MIITAEPHYLVRLPSSRRDYGEPDAVTNKVQVQASEYFHGTRQVLHRLLRPRAWPSATTTNKTPIELSEARRVVEIAKLADGEKFYPTITGRLCARWNRPKTSSRQGASVDEVGRVSARRSPSPCARATYQKSAP